MLLTIIVYQTSWVPPVNREYLGSGKEYTHEKGCLDSLLNELSTDALNIQIRPKTI